MGPDGLARVLRERVAFIFQSFGLLPVLSAAENVGLPMRLARLDPGAREAGPWPCWTSSASAATLASARTSCRAASSRPDQLADRVLELRDGSLVD